MTPDQETPLRHPEVRYQPGLPVTIRIHENVTIPGCHQFEVKAECHGKEIRFRGPQFNPSGSLNSDRCRKIAFKQTMETMADSIWEQMPQIIGKHEVNYIPRRDPLAK